MVDPSLKQAFLTSIPKDLALETFRLIKLKGTQVAYLLLGKFYQYILEALEKCMINTNTSRSFTKKSQCHKSLQKTRLADKIQRQKEMYLYNEK